MDDVARWVNLSFIFFGIIMWWFFARIAETVMEMAEIANAQVLGENLTDASLYGLIAASALTIGLWRNKKLFEWGLNIARELKKVTWPDFDDTKSATRLVIVFTLIVAGILASFDFVFQRLTAMILGVES